MYMATHLPICGVPFWLVMVVSSIVISCLTGWMIQVRWLSKVETGGRSNHQNNAIKSSSMSSIWSDCHFHPADRRYEPEMVSAVRDHFNQLKTPLLSPSEMCNPDRSLRKILSHLEHNHLTHVIRIKAKLIYFPRIPKTSSTAVMNRFAQYLHYSLMQELDQLVHRLLEWDSTTPSIRSDSIKYDQRRNELNFHIHRALKTFYYSLFMDHSYLFFPLSMQINGFAKSSPLSIHLNHFATVSNNNDLIHEMYADPNDIRDRRMHFRNDFVSAMIGENNMKKYQTNITHIMNDNLDSDNHYHYHYHHDSDGIHSNNNNNHNNNMNEERKSFSNDDLSHTNPNQLDVIHMLDSLHLCLIRELIEMNYSISSSISQTIENKRNIIPIQMSFLISGHYPLISSDVEWIRQLPIKLNYAMNRRYSFRSSSVYIFVFIRNPLDRLLSEFNYLRMNRENNNDRKTLANRTKSILKLTGFRSFDECVRDMIAESNHNPCGLSMNYLNSWFDGLMRHGGSDNDNDNDDDNHESMTSENINNITNDMSALSQHIGNHLDFIGFTESFDLSIKLICDIIWNSDSPICNPNTRNDNNHPYIMGSSSNFNAINNINDNSKSNQKKQTIENVLSKENLEKLRHYNQKDLILYDMLYEQSFQSG